MAAVGAAACNANDLEQIMHEVAGIFDVRLSRSIFSYDVETEGLN